MKRALALAACLSLGTLTALSLLIGLTVDASWLVVAGMSGLGVLGIAEAEFL